MFARIDPGAASRALGVVAAAGFVLATCAAASTAPAKVAHATASGASACLASAAPWAKSVSVTLQTRAEPPRIVAFGLPVPPGVIADARHVRVSAGGRKLAAHVATLLERFDAAGRPNGVMAALVELPGRLVRNGMVLEIAWKGGPASGTRETTFQDVSTTSPETVEVARRTIRKIDGRAKLVEVSRSKTVLFTGREPAVLVRFPAGYLAATGILGCQNAASTVPPKLAGLRFVSSQGAAFALSAMYIEKFRVNPDSVYTLDPAAATDPSIVYEGWLYDRCATFLALYANRGDVRFLRTAYRNCSYYARRIHLSGPLRGIFLDKQDPDPKYSHLRGLYAYYALTGDATALAAGKAIADLWLRDPEFTVPYMAGRLRGPDKLWTERLLATSIEGLYYGHLITGEPRYLAAVKRMVATAYRHITGDARTLAELNPGSPRFPPQNCFIHNASQAAEGDEDQPFCSGWMPALLVAPLLAYQDQTHDPRVDEILIRLTRFLRDVGSSYLTSDILKDSFLKPSVPFRRSDGENRRRLVPLYGAGIDVNGTRANYGEYDDSEHCLDASALVAAGLRALKRAGQYGKTRVGPFATEGKSFQALFEELAACAVMTFEYQTRPNRDPRRYTSADLAPGLGDPDAFILDNKIGFPLHNVSPRRKLSWWLNPALEVAGLVRSAGVDVPRLRQGWVQPG